MTSTDAPPLAPAVGSQVDLVLGPLPEATRTLAVLVGKRHWFHTHEHGAHGEGVYSAGQVVAYTLSEVQRAVAAERERCAKVCEQYAWLQDEGSPARSNFRNCAATIRRA